MDIKTAIHEVASGRHLNRVAMHAVMNTIMRGQASPAQIGALLIALRLKGEHIDEIIAAAEVMRELSSKVVTDKTCVVDTCGTGGDGENTFNVSTTAAFVVAAGGANVAKHGNRSVSSQSGSADVLEAAGVNIDLSPKQVAACIEEVGIGFMFAPLHHKAMKHAIGVRRELGTRTIFNLLGPLTNPANAPNQVIGVYAKEWLVPLASVLQQLGSHHVLIVHADDGLDEISIATKTSVVELHRGEIKQYSIQPEDFGLAKQDLSNITVRNPKESVDMLHAVLNNVAGAARDIVCLNAGAAVYVAGVQKSLRDGVLHAQEAIASGAAKKKLEQLVAYSQSLKLQASMSQ